MMSATLMLAVALAAAPQPPTGSATIGSFRAGYDLVKGYLLKAVDQVPEEHFAFKPTPDVRSIGDLFGHIADSNFGICGVASGDKPAMSGIEKAKKTKAELREALAASFKACDAAFDGLTDARANETVKFFLPGSHTRLSVLVFNAHHDWEHYGNIVTYMRLKGLVPPSSQGR